MLGFGSLDCVPAQLPGTTSLEVERPVHEVMVEGINRYCLRLIEEARKERKLEPANIEEKRERFRRIIGAVDRRVSERLRGFELNAGSVVARAGGVTVHASRWPVLDGVTAEGLVLMPDAIRAVVVALPDADQTPEMLCGLVDAKSQNTFLARRLAEAGCLVVVPALISRSSKYSGHPEVRFTNQPHREYLYRQAFEVGRHPIGFEVQKVLAIVDMFASKSPVGVVGVGEGALLALYSAALDKRVKSPLVSGYFNERESVWKEPVYRNVWGLLTEFGDAELAGMIAPRRLVIEACGVETVEQAAEIEGRRSSAAPGRIETCSLDSVKAEYQRAAGYFRRQGKPDQITLVVSGDDGRGIAGSAAAVASFASELGIDLDSTAELPELRTERAPDPEERERRQLDELQKYVQRLLEQCNQVRSARWKSDRDQVHEELIGRLRLNPHPPNPKTRLVIENDSYQAYEVVLDVAPDLIASGILLLPRDLKAGEKRPVVVCQHGLERTSMDTISLEPRAHRSYKSFADRLCRRGFVVYAPQNPHIGGDKFRSIQRKANPLGLSLFSFIIEQHQQTLAWLSSLPQVDADRIAFYGLSYGGKTAMRVPPFLDGYCLTICSGDFTDWPHTIANNSKPYSYVFTGEYEIPEWNLGHVANYAELATLISPRPFMVEAGRRDRGQPVDLVTSEFAKVRRHYDKLGIGDRAEIEIFDGPHTINGQGTFRFLHRHLNWPEPAN